MIESYKTKALERVSLNLHVKEYRLFQRVLARKLLQLRVANSLNDLRVPPGNRLEKLVGDRAGYYSIRVNDQFRLVFKWEDNQALEVELVDYHG
jgi:proteic killer suppression protein